MTRPNAHGGRVKLRLVARASSSASFVLGQPSFETTSAGTTQETLKSPRSIFVSGNKLYEVLLRNIDPETLATHERFAGSLE